MNAPVETKVAAASVTTLLVGAFFGAASFYHWFTPPPLALQATITALLTAVAGWLAPHTSRVTPIKTINDLAAAAHDLGAEVAIGMHPVTRQPQPPASYGTGTPAPGHAAQYKPAATLAPDVPPAQPATGDVP